MIGLKNLYQGDMIDLLLNRESIIVRSSLIHLLSYMGPSCPDKDETADGQYPAGTVGGESAVAGTTVGRSAGGESDVAGLAVGRTMTIIWNSENVMKYRY